MASNVTSSLDDSAGDTKRKRKIKFLPLPSTPKIDLSIHQGSKWSPKHGFRIRKSLWIWISIGVLFVSNVLYAVAFLTNRWGVLLVNQNKPTKTNSASNIYNVTNITSSGQKNDVQLMQKEAPDTYFNRNSSGRLFDHTRLFSSRPGSSISIHSKQDQNDDVIEKFWEFGLWECCRNDGFCLGTRWPAFYSATRAFAVLGLFGHILTLAWMIGYALDNLLEYDPCSMVSLISLNLVTAIFVLLAVCAFGTRWPVEFRNEFHGRDTYLSYSFYLAVDTVILLVLAVIFSIVDLTMSWRKIKAYSRKNWATADEILGDEDEEDGIEEQSWNKITYM